MEEFEGSEHSVTGGDFAIVFDTEDYIAIARAADEVSTVLRAHLIMEEILNIWITKITGVDVFGDVFVPFKNKLSIAENVGLANEFVEFLDRFNNMRNKYSHRRKYRVESSQLDSLCKRVDKLPSLIKSSTCEEFSIHISATTPAGTEENTVWTWHDSEPFKKIFILFLNFVFKCVDWMQAEFSKRGIQFQMTLIMDGN